MNRTQRNTRTSTFQNLKNAAIAQVEAARDAVVAQAGVARAGTAIVLTRLEKAFQLRVSKAVARLGVPSAKEVRALARQLAALEARVAKLRRAHA